MTQILAVVFDAVGTLITPEPSAGRAYYRVGREHGSSRTEAEVTASFIEAYRKLCCRDATDPYRTSETIEKAFWREVVDLVFCELPAVSRQSCFESLFEHFSQPTAWKVYPDVSPTVRELKRRGFIVAIASNFDSRLRPVAEHPPLAAFDRIFVSSEIGWRKPHLRFFQAIGETLGCRPGEMLYVGDEPDSDVAAAIAAGLQARLLRRSSPADATTLSSLTDLPSLLPQRADPVFRKSGSSTGISRNRPVV